MKAHRFFLLASLLSLGLFAASCTKEPLSHDFEDERYVDSGSATSVDIDNTAGNAIDLVPVKSDRDRNTFRRLKGFSKRANGINSAEDYDDGSGHGNHADYLILPDKTLGKEAMYLSASEK